MSVAYSSSIPTAIVAIGLVVNDLLTNTFSGLFSILGCLMVIPLSKVPLTGQGVEQQQRVGLLSGVYLLAYFITLTSNIPPDSNFPIILIIAMVSGFIYTVYFWMLACQEHDVNPKQAIGTFTLVMLIAGGVGYGWATLARRIGLNFFPDKSGKSKNVKCTRPATQAFKCTIYKNGKPIADLPTN